MIQNSCELLHSFVQLKGKKKLKLIQSIYSISLLDYMYKKYITSWTGLTFFLSFLKFLEKPSASRRHQDWILQSLPNGQCHHSSDVRRTNGKTAAGEDCPMPWYLQIYYFLSPLKFIFFLKSKTHPISFGRYRKRVKVSRRSSAVVHPKK